MDGNHPAPSSKPLLKLEAARRPRRGRTRVRLMKPELRKEEGSAAPPGEARPPVILVADDEPVNLALIKRRLEWEDYQLETAEDGGNAVEAAKRLLPDLLIRDLMMPGLDRLHA